MRLQALRHLSEAITEGAIFTLPDTKAGELITGGYAVIYCYWLDAPVEECVYPCYSSDTKKACEHFDSYWQKRLKELAD